MGRPGYDLISPAGRILSREQRPRQTRGCCCGSNDPLITSVCAGIGGGPVKMSIDFTLSMPYVVTIGAGEIAITPATGTRAATFIAIAPPIECPARIVRFASTAPRPIICFTNESLHVSARSNENGPWVRPCPGKSGTNTRNPCSANPRAMNDMIFLFAASP